MEQVVEEASTESRVGGHPPQPPPALLQRALRNCVKSLSGDGFAAHGVFN